MGPRQYGRRKSNRQAIKPADHTWLVHSRWSSRKFKPQFMGHDRLGIQRRDLATTRGPRLMDGNTSPLLSLRSNAVPIGE